MRAPRLALLLTGLVAVAPRLAPAQPMIDPSRMSGIPRPDDTVPAGTISVRVLRGDFAHGLVGQEVTLEGPGGPRTLKTDEGSRAVFKDLPIARGAYTARAKAFGSELASQPIELPPQPGVKVMLVFPKDEQAELGQADGLARSDSRLPKGTLEVRLVDGDDKPLAGVELVLGHARQVAGGPAPPVDEQRAVSDRDGKARFDALAAATGDGYVVSARRDGVPFASSPFRMAESGMLVALRLLQVTRDAKAVAIGKRSILIAEVRDDVVEVMENLVLENSSTSPYDPGPGGIVFPLPAGSEAAQPGPDMPPALTIDGNRAIWKGTLPPGETAVSVMLLLPQHGNAVEIRQRMPLAMEQPVLVVGRFPDMTVEGPGVTTSERSFDGREFTFAAAGPLPAGGELAITLGNLPHASTVPRNIAVGLAGLVALWGFVAAWRRRSGQTGPAEVEKQRQELLSELASLHAAPNAAKDGRRARRREELYASLERLYRDLDS